MDGFKKCSTQFVKKSSQQIVLGKFLGNFGANFGKFWQFLAFFFCIFFWKNRSYSLADRFFPWRTVFFLGADG